MSKGTKLTFTVTITLSEKISEGKTFQQSASDEHIKEVAFKIADALRHECDSGMGLSPENSEAYTNTIEITNDFSPEAKTVVDFLSGAGSKIIQE